MNKSVLGIQNSSNMDPIYFGNIKKFINIERSIRKPLIVGVPDINQLEYNNFLKNSMEIGNIWSYYTQPRNYFDDLSTTNHASLTPVSQEFPDVNITVFHNDDSLSDQWGDTDCNNNSVEESPAERELSNLWKGKFTSESCVKKDKNLQFGKCTFNIQHLIYRKSLLAICQLPLKVYQISWNMCYLSILLHSHVKVFSAKKCQTNVSIVADLLSFVNDIDIQNVNALFLSFAHDFEKRFLKFEKFNLRSSTFLDMLPKMRTYTSQYVLSKTNPFLFVPVDDDFSKAVGKYYSNIRATVDPLSESNEAQEDSECSGRSLKKIMCITNKQLQMVGDDPEKDLKETLSDCTIIIPKKSSADTFTIESLKDVQYTSQMVCIPENENFLSTSSLKRKYEMTTLLTRSKKGWSASLKRKMKKSNEKAEAKIGLYFVKHRSANKCKNLFEIQIHWIGNDYKVHFVKINAEDTPLSDMLYNVFEIQRVKVDDKKARYKIKQNKETDLKLQFTKISKSSNKSFKQIEESTKGLSKEQKRGTILLKRTKRGYETVGQEPTSTILKKLRMDPSYLFSKNKSIQNANLNKTCNQNIFINNKLFTLADPLVEYAKTDSLNYLEITGAAVLQTQTYCESKAACCSKENEAALPPQGFISDTNVDSLLDQDLPFLKQFQEVIENGDTCAIEECAQESEENNLKNSEWNVNNSVSETIYNFSANAEGLLTDGPEYLKNTGLYQIQSHNEHSKSVMKHCVEEWGNTTPPELFFINGNENENDDAKLELKDHVPFIEQSDMKMSNSNIHIDCDKTNSSGYENEIEGNRKIIFIDNSTLNGLLLQRLKVQFDVPLSLKEVFCNLFFPGDNVEERNRCVHLYESFKSSNVENGTLVILQNKPITELVSVVIRESSSAEMSSNSCYSESSKTRVIKEQDWVNCTEPIIFSNHNTDNRGYQKNKIVQHNEITPSSDQNFIVKPCPKISKIHGTVPSVHILAVPEDTAEVISQMERNDSNNLQQGIGGHENDPSSVASVSNNKGNKAITVDTNILDGIILQKMKMQLGFPVSLREAGSNLFAPKENIEEMKKCLRLYESVRSSSKVTHDTLQISQNNCKPKLGPEFGNHGTVPLDHILSAPEVTCELEINCLNNLDVEGHENNHLPLEEHLNDEINEIFAANNEVLRYVLYDKMKDIPWALSSSFNSLQKNLEKKYKRARLFETGSTSNESSPDVTAKHKSNHMALQPSSVGTTLLKHCVKEDALSYENFQNNHFVASNKSNIMPGTSKKSNTDVSSQQKPSVQPNEDLEGRRNNEWSRKDELCSFDTRRSRYISHKRRWPSDHDQIEKSIRNGPVNFTAELPIILSLPKANIEERNKCGSMYESGSSSTIFRLDASVTAQNIEAEYRSRQKVLLSSINSSTLCDGGNLCSFESFDEAFVKAGGSNMNPGISKEHHDAQDKRNSELKHVDVPLSPDACHSIYTIHKQRQHSEHNETPFCKRPMKPREYLHRESVSRKSSTEDLCNNNCSCRWCEKRYVTSRETWERGTERKTSVEDRSSNNCSCQWCVLSGNRHISSREIWERDTEKLIQGPRKRSIELHKRHNDLIYTDKRLKTAGEPSHERYPCSSRYRFSSQNSSNCKYCRQPLKKHGWDNNCPKGQVSAPQRQFTDPDLFKNITAQNISEQDSDGLLEVIAKNDLVLYAAKSRRETVDPRLGHQAYADEPDSAKSEQGSRDPKLGYPVYADELDASNSEHYCKDPRLSHQFYADELGAARSEQGSKDPRLDRQPYRDDGCDCDDCKFNDLVEISYHGQ